MILFKQQFFTSCKTAIAVIPAEAGIQSKKNKGKMLCILSVYAGFRISDFGRCPNPVRNDGFFQKVEI